MAVQTQVQKEETLDETYEDLLHKGAEGVMLRNPKSEYETKRSKNLLKYKPEFDDEAIIIGYKKGTGKYEGMLGSFKVKLKKNPDKEFYVSGMNDKIRQNYKTTHPVGTVITFTYRGLSNSGTPRHPVYMRIYHTGESTSSKFKEGNNDRIAELFNLAQVWKRLRGVKKEDVSSANIFGRVEKLVRNLDKEITSSNDLKGIRGIGKGSLDRIDEILKTGTLQELDNHPDINQIRNVAELMKVSGIGTSQAKKLVDQDIDSISKLQDAFDEGNITLNKHQKVGLRYFKDFQQPIPSQEIKKSYGKIEKIIDKESPDNISMIVGSYSRGKPYSGDMDILLTHPRKNNLKKIIGELEDSGILTDKISLGQKKYMGVYKSGGKARRIDIRYIPFESYYPAVLHFTSSGGFNEKIRTEAKKKGYKLSELGLFKGDKKIKINNEKDIFKKLGIPYKSPAQRD